MDKDMMAENKPGPTQLMPPLFRLYSPFLAPFKR